MKKFKKSILPWGLLLSTPFFMGSLFYNRNQNEVLRPTNPYDRQGDAFLGAEGLDANGDGVPDFTVKVNLLSRSEIQLVLAGANAVASNMALGLDQEAQVFQKFEPNPVLRPGNPLSFGDHVLLVKIQTRSGRTSATLTNRFTLENALYVSPQGSDNQAGLALTPLLTIQTAMERLLAQGGSTLYVMAGTYTKGQGLTFDAGGGVKVSNHNLRLLGGYDSTFSQASGYSTLDSGNAFRVIDVVDATNITLSRLEITGGNDRGSGGGGLRVNASADVRVMSCLIHHNTAYRGGGVAIAESTNVSLSARIDHNTSTSTDPTVGGGGLYLFKAISVSLPVEASVFANTAQFGGGISAHTGTSNLSISAPLYGNTANDRGGGIQVVNTRSVTLAGNVYANYAAYTGGGICATSNVIGLTVTAAVYGNDITGPDSTNRRGSGIYFSGSTLSVSGPVQENSGAGAGTGIAMENSSNFLISGTVTKNLAATGYSNRGGGIYLSNCTGGLISGTVSYNKGDVGGGLFAFASSMFTNTGSTAYNTATGLGGGLVLEQCQGVSLDGRTYSNEADYGAAAYLRLSTNINISGNFSSNKAGSRTGGVVVDTCVGSVLRGVFVENLVAGAANNESGVALHITNNLFADTTTVAGAFFTNTRVGAGGSVIALSCLSPAPGLIFSNNWVGGNNQSGTTYGISELFPMSNHQIFANTFVTNRLGFLYSNSSGSIISNHEVGVLNGTSPRHDAAVFGGNVVTNL